MAVRATVLRADGSSATETFDGDEPPLEWMQEQVGGYIELVHGLPHEVFVNEDAIMKGMPINELAFERFGDVRGSVDGPLRGNVVVVEPLQ
jgi:hypothetical protein